MGVILAFLSALLLSSKDIVSKRLSFEVDGTTSTFASFLFALPFYLVLMVLLALTIGLDITVDATFLWLVFARSITDCFAEWLRMMAFGLADISLVTSFFSLSPLFLLCLSPLITGDIPDGTGLPGVILVALGCFFLLYDSRGKLSKSEVRGVLYSIGAAVCFALNTCFDRLAVHHSSPVVAGFAMTALAAVLFVPAVLRQPKWSALLKQHRRPFLLRGLFEICFMVVKLWALQFMQAPYVLAIMRGSLIFSILGGKVFFREKDISRRLTAGCIIMVGVILVVLRNM